MSTPASSSRRERTITLIALATVSVAFVISLFGDTWVERFGPTRAEAVVTESGADRLVEAAAPDLPFDVTERVQYWIDRFLTTQRRSIEIYLAREGIYGEMIRAKLRERGMPEDLLYLAMMESGLSPDAVSQVAATGVWQFMRGTAVERGLRIDTWVDERRDPVRATDAALDYLEYLHDRFDSWYLAAAAYNAGPGRVSGILRRHGSRRGGDEQLYWDIWHMLPQETQDYVPKILAARVIAGDPEAFGISVDLLAPYRFDRVMVPGGTSLSVVASALDAEARMLRQLNPQLIRGVTPPEGYVLRIPVGQSDRLLTALND